MDPKSVHVVAARHQKGHNLGSMGEREERVGLRAAVLRGEEENRLYVTLRRSRTELLERCLHTVIVVGPTLAIDTVEEVPHCLPQGERPRVRDDGGAVRGEGHLFVSDVQPAGPEQLGRKGGLAVARAATEHDGSGTACDRGGMQVNKLGLRIELAMVEGTSNSELVRRGVGILEEHGAVHPALQLPVRQPIDRHG